MRSMSAPSIAIEFWFAAFIFIDVGIMSFLSMPRRSRTEIPARQDWQPVSATATDLMAFVALLNVGCIPRAMASDGMA